MAGEAAPNVKTVDSSTVVATAAGADASGVYVEAPFAGTVTAASIIAATALTGADTESRTVQLHNRGTGGAGTTLVASKAFVAAVDAAADDETALTLSVVANATTVAEGDLLEFTSLHIGATGLAGPAFQGQVSFSRTAGA